MTDEPLKLICPAIRPNCFTDENPIGYLIRLANLNKYPSYRWLLSGKGKGTFDYEKLYNAFLIEDWAGYQQTVPELREIIFDFPNHLRINALRIRYCPLCLQEEAYWRIGWQIKLATTCIRHQIWLHDLCPHCHSKHVFIKPRRSQCVCLEKLETAKAVSAPQSVIWMQQYLEKGQVNQSSIFFDNNYPLSMEERYKLIAFLLKWQKLEDGMPQPRRQSFEYVSDFQDIAIQCSEVLYSDQSAFWRYLQTIHLSNASYVGIQQKRLVNFYRQFFKQFSEPVYKPIRNVIENYVAMNLIRDINQKHTYFSLTAKQNQLWYSFQKTCSEYDITGSVLSRAIFDKQVNVHFESSENYTKCSVYRPSLEKILPHLKGLISARDAAAILGVTKAQFSQLQNSGCFKFETQPSQDYCSTWQYSKQELESLIENINMGAATITSDCLTISQIMQYHFRGTVEMPFLQLTKAILSGQIIVRKPGSEILKLRALSIDREELMLWLDNCRPASDYLSVTDVSQLFGMNEEFAYQLVNRGYLHHTIDSRRSKVITPFQIKQFNQEYVILSKLSEESGISSAKLVEILESLEIFPVDHNDSKKLRQKLYFRADIFKVKLLFRYAKNFPEQSLSREVLIASISDLQTSKRMDVI